MTKSYKPPNSLKSFLNAVVQANRDSQQQRISAVKALINRIRR